MAKFNKEMSMGEILRINPEAQYVLESFGMHCCGCPMSQAEPLGDACEVHGIDINAVLEELEQLDEFEPENCPCCGEDCDCEDEYNIHEEED